MAVYKLKNIKTGLYWKGGGSIPFCFPQLDGQMNQWGVLTDDGDVKACWSKIGKSWSSKSAFNSAISNMLKSSILYFKLNCRTYYRLRDYKLYDIVVKLLEDDCVVEIYEDTKIINFSEYYKDKL